MYDLNKVFSFNVRKAIEAIVHIATKAPRPDLYHIGKVLYFADKFHLERYGSLICGDKYIAMKYGPVPSAVYDLLKCVRDNNREHSKHYDQCADSFKVAGSENSHVVTALRPPNLDLLSQSELECINLSISRYGGLDFATLKQESHDRAYEKANLDDDIPLEAIIDILPSAVAIKEHIREGVFTF